MNQKFRLKYDEMRENDIGHTKNPNTNKDFLADSFFASEGPIRNICFVLPDGNMEALNYAYLVRHQFITEENIIILEFTTHTVTLKGIRLKPLFFQILEQLNKIIACEDERYNDVQIDNTPVVNHIAVTQN